MNALARALHHIEAAADDAQAKANRIHVCSTVYGAPGGPRYTVLIDGQYYVVNHPLLIALRRGETPASLELEPAEADTDQDDEPEFTIRDHTRAMARSGAFGGR